MFNLYRAQGKFKRQQFDDIFFSENTVWNFMHTVSLDSLHEMSNPDFWNKSEGKNISKCRLLFFFILFIIFFALTVQLACAIIISINI